MIRGKSSYRRYNDRFLCFFKMIEYNNFVMKYGKENLDDYIKHNEINLLEDKNIIIELISRLTGISSLYKMKT